MICVAHGNDPRNILAGDRVMVLDPSLFKDDVSTPLSFTVRPATVVARYGENACWDYLFNGQKVPETSYLRVNENFYDVWKYPDLVDVVFDHRPARISRGHFTTSVRWIQGRKEFV
jgi:hypothetical protein